VANQTIDDILVYLETNIPAEIPELTGLVKVTRAKEPTPGVFSNYGVKIYLGLDKPKEILFKKIGPLAHEVWRINVDFVYNKSSKSRELYSDAKGLSYWESQLTDALMFGTNLGAFKSSFWELQNQEDYQDTVVLRGIFTCEIVNRYG
jgi:hypothetical protein